MPVLNQVLAPDTYNSKNAILSNCWGARGGWFSVTGAGAFVQLQFSRLNSTYQGEEDWTQEIQVGAGAFATLPVNCIGVQFRNSVAGTPATITAQIAVGDEPPLAISALGSISTSGRAPTRTLLGTPGTGTYTPPTAAVAILIELWGGGGGGGGAPATNAGSGGAGQGGAAGAYASSIIPAPAVSYPFTVGAGGVGVAGNNGTAGQTTSFGTGPIVQAGGGAFGNQSSAAAGGWNIGPSAPTGGTIGQIQLTGQGGGPAGLMGAITQPFPGVGGNSPNGGLGGQPAVSNNGSNPGNNGTVPGGGGSGAANGPSQATAQPGGSGGTGLIIITEFY